jgi:hypothetical protein
MFEKFVKQFVYGGNNKLYTKGVIDHRVGMRENIIIRSDMIVEFLAIRSRRLNNISGKIKGYM